MAGPTPPRPMTPSDKLVKPDGTPTPFFYDYLRQQALYIASLEARIKALEP